MHSANSRCRYQAACRHDLSFRSFDGQSCDLALQMSQRGIHARSTIRRKLRIRPASRCSQQTKLQEHARILNAAVMPGCIFGLLFSRAFASSRASARGRKSSLESYGKVGQGQGPIETTGKPRSQNQEVLVFQRLRTGLRSPCKQPAGHSWTLTP